MKTKEIFLEKLKKANYQFVIDENQDFEKLLVELEADAENVFHVMYGDKMIENHGTEPTKEYIYRFLEAKRDVKDKLIKMTMHYLVMQIHISAIKL